MKRRTITRKNKRYRPMRKSAVLCLIMLLLLTMGVTFQSNQPAIADWAYITVLPGDTVWDLAQQYHSENMDIRNYVARICAANDIVNQQILPGQTLRIPILSQ